MAITKETLQAMIREFHGIELSDDELEMVAPALDSYMVEVEKLRDLDLSSVMSGRILRVEEGGNI